MGIEEFLLDQAKKEGAYEGREEGKIEGKMEGIDIERKRTASAMKLNGLVFELISNITGLSEREIIAL